MTINVAGVLREANKYKPIWHQIETVEEFISAMLCDYPICPGPFTASEAHRND